MHSRLASYRISSYLQKEKIIVFKTILDHLQPRTCPHTCSSLPPGKVGGCRTYLPGFATMYILLIIFLHVVSRVGGFWKHIFYFLRVKIFWLGLPPSTFKNDASCLILAVVLFFVHTWLSIYFGLHTFCPLSLTSHDWITFEKNLRYMYIG